MTEHTPFIDYENLPAPSEGFVMTQFHPWERNHIRPSRSEGYCSPQVSRDAQEILEAGLRAADSGQTQTLPLR